MKYSKPLYSILGAYIPLSILILWAPLPGILYRYFFDPPYLSALFSERILLLAGFMSALGASCYMEVMRKSLLRHSAADFRGGIVMTAAAYALSAMLRQNFPWAGRFLPAADTIAPALAALYAWFSVIFQRETFSGLELYESLSSQYRGEELRGIMREYSFEMGITDRRLKTMTLSYGIQFLIPGFLICVSGLSRLPLSVTIPAFLIFNAGFLLLGFFGILRRELSIASEGIYLGARDRALPVPVMATGICAFAILALAGSSDTSILPPEIILGFLGWIFGLFLGLFRSPDPADMARLENRFMLRPDNMGRMFPDAGESVPWEGWKWIKYGVMGIAVLLFLWFMIYPLLGRSLSSFRAGKFFAALSKWWKDLKKGLSVLFGAFRNRDAQSGNMDPQKLRGIASELIRGKIRRKDIKESVNLFARLILWGIETLGIPWKPSCAPGEYCGLLISAYKQPGPGDAIPEDEGSPATQGSPAPQGGVNEIQAAIRRSGELFEKALYSPRRLSSPEENEFRRLIQSITVKN